jgi:hypothetical protein
MIGEDANKYEGHRHHCNRFMSHRDGLTRDEVSRYCMKILQWEIGNWDKSVLLYIMVNEHGADSNYIQANCDSILNLALQQRSIKMLRFLFEHDADPNQRLGSRPTVSMIGLGIWSDPKMDAKIIQEFIRAGLKLTQKKLRHKTFHKGKPWNGCCRNRDTSDKCLYNQWIDSALQIRRNSLFLIGIRKYRKESFLNSLQKDLVMMIARINYENTQYGPLLAGAL